VTLNKDRKMHAPEPWNVGETFCNGESPETVIRGLDGMAAIAVTLDFGPNYPKARERNARRIVACVNACAGIPSEVLEAMHTGPASLRPIYERLKEERDQMAAALTEIKSLMGQSVGVAYLFKDSVPWQNLDVYEDIINLLAKYRDLHSDEGAEMLATMTPPDTE
jgi:hypothetical protein